MAEGSNKKARLREGYQGKPLAPGTKIAQPPREPAADVPVKPKDSSK